VQPKPFGTFVFLWGGKNANKPYFITVIHLIGQTDLLVSKEKMYQEQHENQNVLELICMYGNIPVMLKAVYA
jgi:hypothetical protein